jgi:hypothetical protein
VLAASRRNRRTRSVPDLGVVSLLPSQRNVGEVRIRLFGARGGAVCLSLPWWGYSIADDTSSCGVGEVFSIFVISFGRILRWSVDCGFN